MRCNSYAITITRWIYVIAWHLRCKATGGRSLVIGMLRVGLVLLVLALLASGQPREQFGNDPELAAIGRGDAASHASRLGLPSQMITRPTDESGDAAIDMYGNIVDEAVATYKVDPTGTPYEAHSPQTELPRIAPPRS